MFEGRSDSGRLEEGRAGVVGAELRASYIP
jgi:hypothetical protein